MLLTVLQQRLATIVATRTRFDAVPIGRITIHKDGAVHREFNVESHGRYGVTCATFGTTNGSIRAVARGLADMGKYIAERRIELPDYAWSAQVELGEVAFDIDALPEWWVSDELEARVLELHCDALARQVIAASARQT